MPKKMKKSVGKSDEERQVQLQQRAQAEEELKKKKEETLVLFLKDKLQKEQRNTAVNLLKLHDGWRTILRQTRDAELRHDIIVLQQTFERTLDDLDSVVQKLVGDVQETERQEAHMQRCHLHHMEALWALQAARLQGLQQQWERALEDVSASVRSQRQQMLQQSQQQEIQLQELTLTAELHNTDAMNDIRMLLEDTLAMYTCSLEEQVASLEGREEASDATSLEHLQKSIAKVTQLEKQLADNQKKISEDLKTTKKLEDAVRRLRQKMISNKAGNSSMEDDLTAAINKLNCRSRALQDHLTQSHTAARKRLTELTVQGDAAAKNLQAVVTKGERVLRAADICRRLETQHDTSLTSSSSSRRTDECQQDTPAKDVCRFPELQQLRRSSSGGAVLQREALRKHSKELRRENEQLQLLLRQHDHHAHLPPLHVARAPTTASTTPAARGRSRVTVIEAAHAVLKQ